MEVFDAVDAVGSIDGERDSVEALMANDAREALRMIRLSCRSQDPVQDGFGTDAALFQAVLLVKTGNDDNH